MHIIENEQLKNHTTMNIGGPAKFFCAVDSKKNLIECIKFASDKNLKIEIIGDGSNIIFTDAGFNGLVIKNQIKGFSLDKDGNLDVSAGENWDKVVKKSVEMNFAGIEALSYIPGSVGGAPVNNIGAYGQECKDNLVAVEAYDTLSKKFVLLNKNECQFSYRDSIFKSKKRHQYIIISVKFKLNLSTDSEYNAPEYLSLNQQLKQLNITRPTVQNVRDAVITLRSTKLPDPSKIPNTGSFFKNPIVSNKTYQKLLIKYPDMPAYPYAKNFKKLYAGWLIERANLKNYSHNGICPYKNQALVITNPNEGNYSDLMTVIDHIQKTIKNEFDINLSIEPEIIK